MNRIQEMAATVAVTIAALVPVAAGGRTLATERENGSGAILHAWSWSFDTIAARMADIAKAGYTYVQTSPANTCYVGDGGGMALMSQEGDSVMGKWYYYYQPTDWKIGNYMLGTRDDFKAMADSARAYGVKVIVDVLPNHTAIDHTAVLPDLDAAVGGHDKLYHANGFKPITQWNDRMECTTGEMGGLPDVNTENPDFQYYFMQYVNDLINLGARGFRYDTAKHIGLPSDPLDPRSERNNFWPVFTGREGVKGLSLLMPDSLFIYGEVLQDKNVKELEYSEYMDLTASDYGHALRSALDAGNYRAADLNDWHHPADPSRLVTWVESHDTYCNANESAHIPDEVVRMGWVFLASRASGTPLFFSRPAGSTRENYWGNNRIGAAGNGEYRHPEVVAANYFRRAMAGEPETVIASKDGAVIEVARGSKGVSIINLSAMAQRVDMPTVLADGTYFDRVYGKEWRVKGGRLTGSLPAHTSAIIY
ncbi:MAG: alpha-amylase family glycosyl hydrolase [Alloprevotella sp.]|nr:alpha-amylase family glycosyl hydrolase [Alloprevotella sp.]